MLVLPILIPLFSSPLQKQEAQISLICALSPSSSHRLATNQKTKLLSQEKLLKMSHKSSSVRDQKQQQVNPEIMAQAIDMEVLKKNSPLHSSVTSPRLHRALTKPRSTERGNCLCSPTTHAGSFKCRFHRSSGMIRGGSIGSNLSELVGKSRAINDLV